MKTSTEKKPLLTASCQVIALAVICWLAAGFSASAQIINIAIPDYSFDTWNTSNDYANQYPVSYSPYPTAEIFADWSTTSDNYKFYQVSTAGDTGTFQGTNAVEVDQPIVSTTLSLNPVVASIDNNATYTLTFALYSPNATAGSVTLEMLSTTSAADPTNYELPANDKAGSSPAGPNPTPIITTVDMLATTTISAATIDAQPEGQFTDYSVSFDTLNGDNPTFVGQDLTIGIVVNQNSYSDETQFDNARLTETVAPEPSTWALLGLSLLGLALFGASRRVGYRS